MLKLSGDLINRAVLSLRSGAAIATTTTPLINPNNLKVEGMYCQDHASHKQVVLLYQDIRDMIPQGIVVNDHEALTEPSELVRLKDIISLKFDLLGKPVETQANQKLGKLTDYAVDTETMFIQKLYVEQSLLKSFSGGSLSVDRNQVIEITNHSIIVQDPLQPTKATAPATAPAS